jgi:hypothetical protein
MVWLPVLNWLIDREAYVSVKVAPFSGSFTNLSKNSEGVRILNVCGLARFGDAPRPHTFKMQFFHNLWIVTKLEGERALEQAAAQLRLIGLVRI